MREGGTAATRGVIADVDADAAVEDAPAVGASRPHGHRRLSWIALEGGHDVVDGHALPVVGVEVSGADDAVGIEHERGGHREVPAGVGIVLIEGHANVAVDTMEVLVERELEPIGADDGLVDVAEDVEAEREALHQLLGGVRRLGADGDEAGTEVD